MSMSSIATLLLTNKLAAGVAVAVLASGAAVGTFASQDKLPGQSDGVFFASASATAHPTEAADATERPEASVTPRAIKGIPTDSTAHPQATGTCEKGESVVKTTPAGTQVNVPCQAIEKGDNSNGKNDQGAAAATARSGNSDHTPGPGDQPDGTPTPPSGADIAGTAVAGADDGRAATAVASAPTPHSR